MFSIKYLNFFGVLLLLSVSSLAKDVAESSSKDIATTKAREDPKDKDFEEKLFTTFNTTGTSTTVSGAGIVWLLLWGVVLIILGSAVLCYWVGCEYASTGRRFGDMVGLYVRDSRTLTIILNLTFQSLPGHLPPSLTANLCSDYYLQ